MSLAVFLFLCFSKVTINVYVPFLSQYFRIYHIIAYGLIMAYNLYTNSAPIIEQGLCVYNVKNNLMLRNLVSNIFNVIRIGLDALYVWLGSNLGSVFCILITISQTSISTSVILHICIKEWKELHFHVTRFLSMTLSTFIKTHILYS